MAARKKTESAAKTLDEIESIGDRIAGWAGENSTLILGTGVAILVLAGGYGFWNSTRGHSQEAASVALAAVQRDFRKEMGATGGDLGITEPANPETARRVRAEYVERFSEVAEEHPGTLGETLAWLEVGSLQDALGESDTALETWTQAANSLTGEDTTRALLQERMAGVLENEGRWAEAAEAHASAAEIPGYPLRYEALAAAARCWAEAGETDRALGAFDRLETEAPNQVLPSHVRSTLLELRARQAAF